MKNYVLKRNSGLTLTELLVTTAVVGVMMLGIMSSDYALRQAEQTSARGALVWTRTNAVMTDMIKHANLSTWGVNDPGVVFANLNNNTTNRICMREDNLNTPRDVTDDQWVCFTHRQETMIRCTRTSAQGAGACVAPPAPNTTPIGTVTTDALPNPNAQFGSEAALGTLNVYLVITIINRYDPTLAQDRLSNPQVQITSRAYMQGL